MTAWRITQLRGALHEEGTYRGWEQPVLPLGWSANIIAHRVQLRKVSPHQVQNLGGVGAVLTVALDINKPPQLIGC